MGFFDFFRRPMPIQNAAELADFIDQNAAFVAQKGIYEYARARAGHYSKVLFKEPEFQAAAEHARWRAYPLTLAMVAELVEGVLYPARREDRPAQLDAIRALTLDVFDHYPVPATLGTETWRELRGELDQRLKQIGLHPPKWVKDIPESMWESYFNVMPIHQKLKGADAPVTRNYLRVTLINIHEQLTKRLDAPAVADSLRTGLNWPNYEAPPAAIAAN
jgi:hypothetical protein